MKEGSPPNPLFQELFTNPPPTEDLVRLLSGAVRFAQALKRENVIFMYQNP